MVGVARHGHGQYLDGMVTTLHPGHKDCCARAPRPRCVGLTPGSQKVWGPHAGTEREGSALRGLGTPLCLLPTGSHSLGSRLENLSSTLKMRPPAGVRSTKDCGAQRCLAARARSSLLLPFGGAHGGCEEPGPRNPLPPSGARALRPGEGRLPHHLAHVDSTRHTHTSRGAVFVQGPCRSPRPRPALCQRDGQSWKCLQRVTCFCSGRPWPHCHERMERGGETPGRAGGLR